MLAEGDYDGRGGARAAGTLTLSTPPAQVVPGVWTRVELIFDGRVARILVDGREVGRDTTNLARPRG